MCLGVGAHVVAWGVDEARWVLRQVVDGGGPGAFAAASAEPPVLALAALALEQFLSGASANSSSGVHGIEMAAAEGHSESFKGSIPWWRWFEG